MLVSTESHIPGNATTRRPPPRPGHDSSLTTLSPRDILKSALFVDFDNVYSGLRRLDQETADQFARNPTIWMNWLTYDDPTLFQPRLEGEARPRPRDGAGRPLIPWPGGIVRVGQIFLYSPFAGSYDSRYFGPVPVAGILGLARPLLTFEP